MASSKIANQGVNSDFHSHLAPCKCTQLLSIYKALWRCLYNPPSKVLSTGQKEEAEKVATDIPPGSINLECGANFTFRGRRNP